MGSKFRYGGGSLESVLSPVVLAVMLIAILLVWLLPRRYAIAPLLAVIILVPLGQDVVLGGVHFYVTRIMLLAGWTRVIVRRGSRADGVLSGGLNTLDKVFVLWAIFRATAGVLLFMATGAVINQCGFLLDALGGYFLFRHLIQDEDDIFLVIRVLTGIVLVICPCMLYEKFHQLDLFGYLGGVKLIPEIREGAIRAQGPFQHEILAGTFGATLVPLFVLAGTYRKRWFGALLGLVASGFIAVAASASTALLALGGGVIAMAAWPLRKSMRSVRWAGVAFLVGLQAMMKAPVWYAITHVTLVTGSSNYQRTELIQQFVTHFSSWFLIGTTANVRWGKDMWDTLNQFVQEGVNGGLATLLCFVALLVICFRWIGKARKSVEGDRSKEWFFWLLGAELWSHVVGFFGASYFDQTRLFWFAVLAMIAAGTASVWKPATSEVPRPAAIGHFRADIGGQRRGAAIIVASTNKMDRRNWSI